MLNITPGLCTRIRTVLFTGLLGLSFSLQAAPQQLTINGSNTIGAELAPLLVEGMLKESGARDIQMQLNPASREHLITAVDAQSRPIRIELNAHGSSTGFTGLTQQTAQIAAASRPIRDSEVQALADAGDMRSKEAEQVIGLDGLAIIVHPQNPLSELSVELLARIFSGQITRWDQLDGSQQGNIRLYARDSHSGTWETFRDLVLTPRQLELHDDARRYESNTALTQVISNDPSAIGFVALANIEQSKALTISAGDSQPMSPTQELVATEDYPLARRLYMYIRPDESNPLALDLIRFTQSQAGQKMVEQVGFVGQNIKTIAVQPHAEMPDDYRKLAEQAQRLSVNFRFEEGNARLDNKARQDIDRILAYLRQHNKTADKVVLVGFGDSGRRNAELLSRLRAMTIRRELVSGGITVKDLIGLGDELPVAADTNDDGRVRNRRVEVWVY